MSKERMIWIDSLKGWLILIVVLGHAIQYCLPESHDTDYWWNLIYSFHMPAFMAVSGYVNYRANSNRGGGYTTLFKRRSYQLLVPYLIWSLIKWILFTSRNIVGITNIIMKPDGYFWFLWVLWVISIIFIAGDYVSNKLKMKQEVVIGLIALMLVGVMVFFDLRVIGFQFIAYYFIFYAFGYYCNKYKKLLTKNKAVWLVMFIVWLVMGSFWNMHELPFFLKSVTYIPSALLQYAYRFATAFVAIYLLICATPMLLRSNNKFNLWIAHLGQISLGVYVVHLMLIIPMSPWLVSVMPNVPIPVVVLISFVLAAIISICTVELLNKNKYTSRYLLGKL